MPQVAACAAGGLDALPNGRRHTPPRLLVEDPEMKVSRFIACCAFALGAGLNTPAPASAQGGTQGNFCHLQWDIPCCPDPCGGGFATVMLTICNYKAAGAEFEFHMNGPAGVMFMPQVGFVGVASGDCIDIPITVKCPPGLGGFVFSATVIKVGTPETSFCEGSIRDTGGIKGIPLPPVVDAPAGVPVRVPVMVQLPATFRPAFFDIFYRASMQPSPFQVNPPMTRLSLNGLPPGEPVLVDSFFDIFYEIDFARGGPIGPEVGDILIEADLDGDGLTEPIGSLTVRGVPRACLGDMNGDGIVDTGDLGILISLFGQSCF